MKLTHDDVNEILQLLDAGPFDELHLQTLRFKLSLRRGGDGAWAQSTQILSEPNIQTPAAAKAAASAPKTEEALAPDSDHLVGVRAPLLGTFYRAPKPGAPPFVEVGSHVEKDTVIGIIETMKLMNSVYAGTRGTVVDIRVKDGDFVENEGILMRIEERR